MDTIAYEITKRYLADNYDIKLDDMDKDITQDINEYSNTTQLVKDIPVANKHELMLIGRELSLIGMEAFAKGLHTRSVDGKLGVYLLDDKIKLSIDKGRITMYLRSVPISGKKRFAVLKLLLETVGWINHYTSNGWKVFTVELNGREYNIGYLEDNPVASFMSVKKQSDSDDYYNEYYKQTSSGWRRPRSVELETGSYGDNATGLGSIFTDQVKEELDEINAYIQTVKNDPIYADEIDAIQATLEIDIDSRYMTTPDN